MECLETRAMLHGDGINGPHDSDPEFDLDDFHIHAQLTISINGEIQAIPDELGVETSGQIVSTIHTHEPDNVLHIHEPNGLPLTEFPTLGDFFEAWRTNGAAAGNNPNATFSRTEILGNVVDSENTLRMFVNGVETAPTPDYQIHAEDNIVLAYGSNPLVNFQTNQGPILLELFPEIAPITVDNFLTYVNDGDYENNIFHRLDPGFVLQGGGFQASQEAYDPMQSGPSQFPGIDTDAAILNEPTLSNTRGTIAMARVGGSVNSATSQWFVNYSDSNAFLDDVDEGFTVFGQVLGMHTGNDEVQPSTVDRIEQFNIVSAGGAFGELPLDGDDNVVLVEAIEGEGIVRGTVFVDANFNGVFDDGETPIEGVVVFSDEDNNETLDDEEHSATSDADGNYVLHVHAGTNNIRQIVEDPFVQTSPDGPDFHVVDVPIGREVNDFDFANVDLSENDDEFTVGEDFIGSALDVLANDDIGGSTDDLVVESVSAGSQGGTILNATDGSGIFYMPAPDFFGIETFTYTYGNGTDSQAATVFVTVTPVNDPPTAIDDDETVDEDVPTELDLLENDEQAPDVGETLRIIAVGATANGGTVEISSDGLSVTYTSPLDFSGTDSFTYTISDREQDGLTSEATVMITVNEVNDDPVATVDTANLDEDGGPITIDVLANDTFAPDEGETLTITDVDTTPLADGSSVEIAGDSLTLSYTPAPDFFGIETFTYTIRDDRGGTAEGVVTVTVNAVNDPPNAGADEFIFTKNTGPHDLEVLVNDDAGGGEDDTLTITDVSAGSLDGTIEIIDSGRQLRYTPATDVTGDETFTYTVDDGNGGSVDATVTVTLRDFIPSELSGFVYFDDNDDGVFDDDETPIGGVTITLAGTNDFGEDVNLSTVTAADGSYSFTEVAPGDYTITETQPEFVLDGSDTIGTQGGDVADDVFTIDLAEDTVGTDNNFAELGRNAQLVGLMDFFAIRPEPSLVAAVGPSGQTWYEAEGDWEAYDSVRVDISADETSIDVTTVDDANGEQTATVPLDGVQAQIDQQIGDMQLIAIMPSSADLGFMAAMAMALAAQEDATDDDDNMATDAVFEMMGV